MKKIKIAYISETLSGGVRKHVVDLLNYMDKGKFEIHFIYGTNRMDSVFIDARDSLLNVEFYPINEMEREINFKKDFAATKNIIRILKEIKPDIVHCHSSKAGVLGRIAAKCLRIKQVYYTPHGYIIQDPNISRKKKQLFCFIEKFLAWKCTSKVVHVSKGEESEAIKNNLLDRNKSVVVYNGMKIFNQEILNCNETFNVVTIARMDDQKNPWDAIKLIEKLLTDYPQVKYTFVGDGKYYDEIAAYVKNNGLDKKIILPGFMDKPYEVLKEANLFLLTSLYEGLPYALIEAMAYKVPLLASDVIGNNELVVNNYNGLLYRLDDVEDGREKLKLLIEDKVKLKGMSKNAYEHYLNHFTVDKMIQTYEQLYTGVDLRGGNR